VADVADLNRGAGLRHLWGAPRSRRHRALTAAVSEVLRMPVGIALPLQRRRPDLIFATCVAELVALGALIVTASTPAAVLLAVLAAGLLGLGAANDRRILAVTSTGVVVLAASSRGRPVAMIDTAAADLVLPAPAGLGVPVTLRGKTWWVDRSGFARLERARELVRAGGERATGGEGPGSSS
jgi:hypothetical protein